MRQKFTILIADRSHNIREFLKRELEAEGYLIKLANNGLHTLLTAYEDHPIIQKTTAAFLEKNENNINSLKEKIAELLRKNYSHKVNKGTKRTFNSSPSRSSL